MRSATNLAAEDADRINADCCASCSVIDCGKERTKVGACISSKLSSDEPHSAVEFLGMPSAAGCCIVTTGVDTASCLMPFFSVAVTQPLLVEPELSRH